MPLHDEPEYLTLNAEQLEQSIEDDIDFDFMPVIPPLPPAEQHQPMQK